MFRSCNYFCFALIFLLFHSPPMVAGGRDTLMLSVNALTVKDGLSQGLISCIMQDKEGFMWFGTKDGLNKYDGYHFTVYKHEPGNPFSLPDNYVSGIIEDDSGNFWVGTYSKGLFLFDKKSEKFYPVKLSAQKDSLDVQSAIPLKYFNGKLLVATTVKVLYDVSQIKPDNYKSVVLDKNKICWDERIFFPRTNINFNLSLQAKVYMDQNKIIALYGTNLSEFISDANGIYKLIKTYQATQLGFENDMLVDISYLEEKNQYLIAGTYHLIFYDFKNDSLIKKIPFYKKYSETYVSLLRDNSGNYYLTAPEEHWQFLNIADYSLQTITGITGNCSYIDRSGILWNGTGGNGIIIYDFRKSLFRPIAEHIVGPLKYNGNGEQVIYTNMEPSFYNFYSKKAKPVFQKNTWQKNWNLHEFATDRNGNHWIFFDKDIKTWHVMQYNPLNNEIRTHQVENLDYHNQVKLIFDNENNLWLNTFDVNGFPKLIKWNKEKFTIDTIYNIPAACQLFFGYFISAYHQDKNNVFWFATTQGLYSFNPNAKNKKDTWHIWRNVPGNKNSLSYDYLLTLLPDPKEPERYLWLGSDGGGLSRFDKINKQFINYTENDGLPNNVVYGILSDNAGNLWMSTNKGICCMHRKLATQGRIKSEAVSSPLLGSEADGETFTKFTSEDGLPGDEFNRHEYFKMPNGDLYFEGVSGGVLFNPQKLLEKETAPPVVLTGLSVYNKPVSYKTDSSIIQMPVEYAKRITLPHDKGMFTISFAALEYRAASKKHYAYILEGHDNAWIESGIKNEATYTNLPPGTYTFRVKGASSTGVWNEQGTSIQIIINPAWYQTLLFKIAIVLAIAGSIIALYRYRLKQQIKLMNIRNRIASDLHDEIGSTLSSISISSTIIQNKMNGSESEIKKLLNQISINTDNMMEAMSDIVWAINTKNDRFENVINRMRAFAIEILEPIDCRIHFNFPKELANIHLDMTQRKNLYLIFKEAINNAAKYSGCKNVWIDFTLNEKKKLLLKIKDDGKGFVPQSKQINFHFPSPNGEGGQRQVEVRGEFGGNGLTNIQKRARDIKGIAKILSEPEKGTELILEFEI